MSRLRQDDGFTLVELLVAMSLSLIVLFATLDALDAFTSEAAHQTRLTDANDQARQLMDRAVIDLRGASTITAATATNLAYSVPDTAGVRNERICVDSGELYGFSALNSSVTTAACSSGTRIAHLRSTTSTAFTYDGAATAAAPEKVRNVGIIFSLDASRGGRTGSSTLKASAAVRRTVAMLPIGPPDVPISCSKAGPVIQVGVGLGLAEDLGPLTVTFTASGGVSLSGGTVDPDTGSAPITLPPEVTSVVATITDSLGIVRALIPKTVECVT